MSEIEDYFISYPAIEHPLADEKLELKLKYIALLEHYRTLICPDSKPALARCQRFIKDFLGQDSFVDQDIALSIKEIMRSRFTPFRFFSYRYVFLFDCIYLLSIDDVSNIEKIGALVKESVNRRYHKKMDFIVEKVKSNPSELSCIRMITPEMIHSLAAVQKYLPTKEKNVVFTATMSAGKSTLINAIIGQALAQTKKAACTAAVMEYISSPIYHPKYNVHGVAKDDCDVLPQEVRSLSEGGSVPIKVVGYFNSGLSQRKVRVIDTPGVNSSRNPEHRTITRGELTSRPHDVLVYVIPVENYGGEDDFLHLQFVREHAKYKKIVFVVNMMDTCDFEDDSVDEILDNIRDHLESIGFDSPLVCPLSAKAALIFKKALSNVELSQNEKNELDAFCRKFEDDHYDLGPFYQFGGTESISSDGTLIDENRSKDIYRLYSRTGMPQFESTILSLFEGD